MGLVSELRRRNVTRVAIAYAIAAWLLIEVTATIFPILGLPAWSVTLVTALLFIGFPLALIFSWAFELTPEGIKLEKHVVRDESITHLTGRKLDFVIIAMLVMALGYFAFDKFVLDPSRDAELVQTTTEAVTEQAAETTDKSVAVLPFTDLSPEGDQEYFSDGISEELLNVLIKVEGLRVVSRTSSFAFKDKDIGIPSIAKELNVNHVLEGSVRKAGNTVRVTAQLIDVRTDSHLWSETYDRELEDIFAIQDEISGQIVEALKIALGAGEQEAIIHAQQPTENLAAYELYLRGRYLWQRRGEDNIRHAIDLFEQATKLDPQFARAWSSLAAAHATLPNYSDAPMAEQQPLAVSAAQKALMLDDSLAEAHAVLGAQAFLNREWVAGKVHDLRAIASEPKNWAAHQWYGEHLLSLGRIRDALDETLIAYQLDPLHPATNNILAWIYFFLEDTHNTLKYGAAAWELGHTSGLRHLAWANLRLGEVDRAIELAEQYDEKRAEIFKSRMTILKLLIEAKTDTVKRPMFFEKLTQSESALPFLFLIPSYAGLGRIDDAYRVANLRLGSDSADPDNAWWVLWYPDMAAFRQDPRFAKLVTELGLMDYWREHGWPDACQPAGDSLICE